MKDSLFDVPKIETFDMDAFAERQAHNARLLQAKAERDARMADVEEHAAETWKDTAERIVIALAQSGRHFTSDDVMDALAASNASTHDARALGPVMAKAIRREWIHKTGYVPSRRRHSTAIAQYVGII